MFCSKYVNVVGTLQIDDDDDDDDAEIRAVLGSRTADADSIGQRVSGESDIRAHLSRV